MFDSESILQLLVHERPDVILSGIPEINPQFCPDTPAILSLGREIPLNSGPIDNLYIDTNAIITFVECKRYSDSRIKREVYSQAINYASDLRNMLSHFHGNQFCDEFFRIIRKGQGGNFETFDQLVSRLSEDPILGGKHIADWKEQFVQRLEYNIKHGVFRIVIACGPSPESNFSYSAIRNLIQLMNYSEVQNNRYDLILLDIRRESDQYVSKIIWRSYAFLPQIPLIAQATRDTSTAIDAMQVRRAGLPADTESRLDELVKLLSANGVYLVENTHGFAAYSSKLKRSLYTLIEIQGGSWRVLRHQIRIPEALFDLIKSGKLPEALAGLKYSVQEKTTPKGPMYEVAIELDQETRMSRIASAITGVLGSA